MLAMLVVAGRADAAAKRVVAVELIPASDWRASALHQALVADLADDQLTTRAPSCKVPCADAALRGAGIELVVRAELAGETLRYELRALWAGAPPPARATVTLRGLDRVGFAGVLRDRLHRMARATESEDATEAKASDVVVPSLLDMIDAWLIALAVLAAPVLVGLGLARRRIAVVAARRTFFGMFGAAALGAALTALSPTSARSAWFVVGGVAWGVLAAVTLPVVFPPLVGMARADDRELRRLIAGWLALVARRAVSLAVIYAPVVVVVERASADIVVVDPVLRRALVLPLALLVARHAVRLAIAVAAERLDAVLRDPAADTDAWQRAVRGYFTGYVRRNNLALDPELLARLAIVPSRTDEVAVYGGGATHPRIAIPRRMLEHALAPWGRPHDYAAPRVSTLHWAQWNAGLVMAAEPGAPLATRDQRQPRETTDEGDPSENAREHIGEPPTLIGIIEPLALDPRTHYRPHDDPAWLDWDLGEEHDGTDAGDRDFLFGVLVHAVAQIQRHGDRPSTLALALQHASRLTARLGRWLARRPDPVADDHAAISGARHHLVQYLGWLAWQRDDLLTARAYAPELEAMSRRLIAGHMPARAAATVEPTIVVEPAAVAVVEEPAPVDVVEAPAPVAAVEDPAPVAAAEEPAPVVAVEEPAPVVAVEEPAPVAAAEEPAPVVAVEEPAPVVAAEEPASVVVEEPALVVVEEPAPAPVEDEEPPWRDVAPEPEADDEPPWRADPIEEEAPWRNDPVVEDDEPPWRSSQPSIEPVPASYTHESVSRVVPTVDEPAVDEAAAAEPAPIDEPPAAEPAPVEEAPAPASVDEAPAPALVEEPAVDEPLAAEPALVDEPLARVEEPAAVPVEEPPASRPAPVDEPAAVNEPAAVDEPAPIVIDAPPAPAPVIEAPPAIEPAPALAAIALLAPTAESARAQARIARLSALIRGAPPARTTPTRVALTAVLLAGVAALAFAIADAIRYHATYLEQHSQPPTETTHGKT